MEKEVSILKEKVIERKQRWENAKNPIHVVSIFVCNRRIQKLDEAIKLLDELAKIDEYTK